MAFSFYLSLVFISTLLVGLSAVMVNAPSIIPTIAGIPTFADIWYTPLFGLFVTFLLAFVQFLFIRSREYIITTKRLVVIYGIFSLHTEEIELYRVIDWSVRQPLLLRMLNYGHINLFTIDATAPKITLFGLANPEKVRDTLRTHVQIARRDHKVIIFD